MMRTFYQSNHCRAGANCRRCRSLVNGRGWRAQVADRYGGVDGVDFPCVPKGLPWTENEVPPPGATQVVPKDWDVKDAAAKDSGGTSGCGC